MFVKRVSVLCVLAVVVAVPIAPCAQQAAPKQKTLYERLGGYDMIAKIVDALLPKLGEDPVIRPVVDGLAENTRNRNRQFIVDQICNLTGGPCLYTGRTMEASHQGLNITDEMWMIQQKHLGEVLDEHKVRDPERAELIAVIETLRPGIVEKKKEETKKP